VIVVEPSFVAFVPVAALLIVAPGPDVLLVIRNATRSRGAGVATAVGTVTGLLVHATAATVGLSALVAASAKAFMVVKVIGAVYLVLLGGLALWSSRRSAAARPDHHRPNGTAPLRPSAALRQGVLTNVLNPKVAVFFVAFLPQFIPAGSPTVTSTLLLAAVFITMTAGYLLLLVALTVRAAGVLARPTVRRWLDRLAAAVFIGFGVRLATASR
jgi:threonine/homoserine/homoserine lactone efflux protein